MVLAVAAYARDIFSWEAPMKRTTVLLALVAALAARPAHAQIVHMQQTIFGMD